MPEHPRGKEPEMDIYIRTLQGWPWYGQLAMTFLPFVGWVMLLASQAEKPIVRKYGQILAVPLLTLYLVSLFSSYLSVMASPHIQVKRFAIALSWLFSTAFLLGGSMVLCQDIRADSKGVVVRRNSIMGRLIRRVEARCHEDDLIRPGTSLCKASWVLLALLLISPTADIVVRAGCILMGFARSLITLENPIPVIRIMTDEGRIPEINWQRVRYRGKILFSPAYFLSIGLLAWLAKVVIRQPWGPEFIQVIGTIAVVWLVWILIGAFGYLLDLNQKVDFGDAFYGIMLIQGTATDPSTGKQYTRRPHLPPKLTVMTSLIYPFGLIWVIYRVLKGSLCPAIRYVE